MTTVNVITSMSMTENAENDILVTVNLIIH